ncbi:uncharacterized protein LOC141812244 [Curcuma longa]|uniref:uncharacterized protein LOC141812244 n=1 Tax=Curcuma longa TaxID=136217 RepID=UPI003D9F09A1
MPDAIPACFRGGGAAGPRAPAESAPSLTTSVYETHLGVAALTWSRAVFGVSLRAVLRIYADGDEHQEEEEEEELLHFVVRPWLMWKRRGTKRFHLNDPSRHRCVDFDWDLTRSRFPPGGGPEPVSGYFVAVSVDGEMLLVAGDLVDEVYRKSNAQRRQNHPVIPSLAPISRQEHVALVDHAGRRSYNTLARFAGQEHQISIELAAKEKGLPTAMSVEVNGERILHVRRLRWKFRGSEKVDLGRGKVQVSWDLHNWFFQASDEAATDHPGGVASEQGRAVFLLRFEGEEGRIGHAVHKRLAAAGSNGRKWNTNWSDTSSGGGGEEKRRPKRSRLRKTGSSSSSASLTSTASSSSVMEWASAEEEELRRAQGFSLLLYATKR